MARSETTEISKQSLPGIFNRQQELYDLHSHLLGMGSSDFWIHSILEERRIMPTQDDFRKDSKMREELCRLIWNNKTKKFIDGNRAAAYIQYLIDQDYPRGSLNNLETSTGRFLPGEQEIFFKLTETEGFVQELQHRNLGFKSNFCYDVVLKLSDLAKGLGVKEGDILVQTAVEEKLGIHTSPSFSCQTLFRHWIIFNAREQRFEIAYGMTVEQLRSLIKIDRNISIESNKLARSHIINAFSMCSADGTSACHIDFHRFQGAFTPEFYPRRFALKDSIYSQRLDVLAHLLVHVLLRYQICRPPVTYCELSVGVGDITRPWVFDVLCSFPPKQQQLLNTSETSFRQLILAGHFSELRNACETVGGERLQSHCVPNCTYKFLAGFDRKKIQTTLVQNQTEAVQLLDEAPQLAIHMMLNEINKSVKREPIAENDLFYQHFMDLQKIKEASIENDSFYDWVVGLDLFGDEKGYPYCPFVASKFIDYVKEQRVKNNSFGLRIHCGENVPFANANEDAYRHFAAHMYIVLRCLRYLQYQLEYGIRIGHGIAFERILDGTMSSSKHRKSSVLLAEIKEHARYVFKTIAFEVNITSNEYLLGHALRRGDFNRVLQFSALVNIGAPIVLATDDDGVWPIDHCQSKHTGHLSLPAEYCRAMSSDIIETAAVLEKIFDDTRRFPFYSRQGQMTQMPRAEQVLPNDTRLSPVVIHPDIIKLIVRRCHESHTHDRFYTDFSRAYLSEGPNEANTVERSQEELDWENTCRRLAPIAYLTYYSDELESNNRTEQVRGQYFRIFGENPSFQNVKKQWVKVHHQLIGPNIPNQSQCASVNVGESRHDFFSLAGPLTSCLGQSEPLRVFMDHLQRNYDNEIHIYAFTRHINVLETITEINKQLLRNCDAKLRVCMYSNKEKAKYTSFRLSNNLQLQINQQPSERTDYNGEKQQNGLYAVCPHASAATAFLHFVGKHLLTDDNARRPVHNTQEQPVEIHE